VTAAARWGAVGLVVLLALAPDRPARAHEFWILPSTYRPAVGATLDVGLRVGHGRTSRAVRRNEDDIAQFILQGGDVIVPVAGAAGADPAGRVAVPAAGCWWLGYRSALAFSSLEPERFEAYLRQKGLESVLDERAARGEEGRYGVEMYSRCAKALVASGRCGDTAADDARVRRPLGFTLELVPALNPDRLRPGDALAVRLLFRRRPLAGALVEAWPVRDPTRAVRRRTDAQGRVRIPLEDAGTWLVSAVHMTRGDGPARAQWESWWASLSFALQAGPWRELRFERRRFLPGQPFPTRPLAPGRHGR
jgi:hypothetical protein